MPIKCPPAPVAANPALVIQTAILKAGSALTRFHSKSRAGNIYNPNTRKRIEIEEEDQLNILGILQEGKYCGAPTPVPQSMHNARRCGPSQVFHRSLATNTGGESTLGVAKRWQIHVPDHVLASGFWRGPQMACPACRTDRKTFLGLIIG
jgi:hypothetical protein